MTLREFLASLQAMVDTLPETADLPVLVRDTSECGGGEQLREPYIDVKPVDACYAGPPPWTGKPDKLAVTF